MTGGRQASLEIRRTPPWFLALGIKEQMLLEEGQSTIRATRWGHKLGDDQMNGTCARVRPSSYVSG